MPDQDSTLKSKYCGGCKKRKAHSFFHKSPLTVDGCATQCKKCKSAYDKANRARFRDRLLSAPSASTEYRHKWNTENKELKNSYTIERRQKIKTATPSFADKKEIRKIYNGRPENMHVDHIIPITSNIVCGLHVHWNLQYLTPQENSDKGNKIL